jgi:predicted deacetylase
MEDGPNVAYHGTMKVQYSQVKLAVEQLEQMGERPLVTMPSKYVAPRFRLSMGHTQKLTEKEIRIMER